MVGKLVTTVFLSVFIFAGLFFGTKIFGELDNKIDQQGWVERPCTVIDSGVAIDASDNEPYTPWVDYTYTHGGRDYRSNRVSDSDAKTSSYRQAQAVTLAYAPGSSGKAYINPDDPGQSVLDLGTGEAARFGLFGTLFLLFFTGIPLFMIVAVWRSDGHREDKKARAKAARGRGGKAGGKAAGVLFGGVFAVAGGAMLVFMTVLPLIRTASTQGWNAVPCTVERSAVLTYRDSEDGDTYRIDILYFYEVAGQRYGSNRYDFAQIGSSSGYDGKAHIVRQYPVGQQTTCFVDPDDPTHAVLHRGLSLSNLWGLFPLPFLIVGLAVMYFSLRGDSGGGNKWRPGGGKAKCQAGRSTLSALPDDAAASGPVTLRPGSSRIGGFVGMSFAALFWNGIVSVFVYQLGKGWLEGDGEVIPSLFMVPFLIVGVVLIGVAIRKLMLIFAPSVVIELGRRSLPLGGSTPLRWRVVGGTGRVEAVKITLIGQERATYRRGTDTVTDTNTFFEQVLVGGEDPERQDEFDTLPLITDRGEAVLRIAQDTMHSFEADNNAIDWRLRVQAKVARWPDPKDEHTLTVLPVPIDR